MKKFLSILLIVTMVAGLSACGSKENNNQSSDRDQGIVSGETGSDNGTAENKTADNSETNEKHIVVDHAGNQVEVSNNINRIVVADIYPMASVLTVFFDSAEKIVGISNSW